ncbi:glycosyltransferase family 2 protein [Halobacteriaceae archaeon SHR40]|uniref:glycosyltransferase family 2 protein n=1 Tax=Halovenus amylolytica TaxID=2500550 RepID=UPI000FE3989F
MVDISVVIPTYNRADSIEQAIDSALGQSLSDIEVIVVDDGSTDATAETVSRINDQRLTFIQHKKNKGGSAARNTGIDHASGKYIAFLDSDDTWKATKLEKQLNLLKARSDDWVAAYCDFRQTRSNPLVEVVDNLVRRPTGLEGGEELINMIFLRKFAHGGASTLLVKADAVERLDGFDPSFQRHQDLEFLVRLLQIGKLAYVSETLVYKHDTGNPPVETTRAAMNHFNETFADTIASRGLDDDVCRVQSFMIAKYNFRDGEFKTGFQNLRRGQYPHHRDLFALVLAVLSGIRSKTQK